MRKSKAVVRKLATLKAELGAILRRRTTDIISAGNVLIEIRDSPEMEHGQWLPCLSENFDLPERTARNWMAAARYVAAKSATVADLIKQNIAPGVLYKLGAGEYDPAVERRILNAAKSTRVDIDRAHAIEAAWEHEQTAKSQTEEIEVQTMTEGEAEAEASAILDGPPPELAPVEPVAPDPDRLICEELAKWVLQGKKLGTKKPSRFARSNVPPDDIDFLFRFLTNVKPILGIIALVQPKEDL
jgi:hypothetical protein